MSLLLAGAVVGASITILALLLIVLMVGIHRQERMALLTDRPNGLSAVIARRILGLHTPRPSDEPNHSGNESRAVKETFQ